MQATGKVSMGGRLGVKVITREQRDRNDQRSIRSWRVRNWFRRWREGEMMTEAWLWFNRAVKASRIVPGAHMPTHGRLFLKVIKADGRVLDYGQAGCHLIVDDGHEFLADAMQALQTAGDQKFHGTGTGTTAAAVTDTALETELTTQYATDSTRPTGTQTEDTAKIYRTVGSNTVDATVAATEWGLLDQASTAGGVLFDRQVFTVVNLASGDTLQTTYDLTFA